jgi:hypothetical protein
MFGESDTPTFDTTLTFRSVSTPGLRVWAGASICVSLHSYFVHDWQLVMILPTVVLSERIKNYVQMCEIRDEIWGASDHCPVVLEIANDAVL